MRKCVFVKHELIKYNKIFKQQIYCRNCKHVVVLDILYFAIQHLIKNFWLIWYWAFNILASA